MKRIKIILLVLSALMMSACAELSQIAKTVGTQNMPLSNAEIISGLKEALLVGTDSSVSRLSALNGYLKDEAVKILLPPEARTIMDNVSKIPGGAKLVDDVILSINRAAEDAAKGAKPIFVRSVKEMTFTDALQILRGPDNAATSYFKQKTSTELANLYRPKIQESLNKAFVAGITTQQSWNKLTSTWNKFAGSTVGQIAGYKTVDVKLEDYLLQQALNGLFLKIEEREKDIRNNASARVTDILRRVFGSQPTS